MEVGTFDLAVMEYELHGRDFAYTCREGSQTNHLV
jgi:hypothetical protein